MSLSFEVCEVVQNVAGNSVIAGVSLGVRTPIGQGALWAVPIPCPPALNLNETPAIVVYAVDTLLVFLLK